MTHLDQDKLISSLLGVKKLLLGHAVKLNEEEFDEIADALCQIETIYLGRTFPLDIRTIERLKINLIYRNDIKMKNLFIFRERNWRNLVSPQDLEILLAKLKMIRHLW